MKREILLRILSGDIELSKKYTSHQIIQALNDRRRLLTKEESDELHANLKKVWDVDGYWYPLKSNKAPEDLPILCLQDSKFEPYKYKLRDELLKNNVQNIFELREHGKFGAEYEMNTEIFDPFYGGSEGFWFDKDMGWLIYVSHEDSITFAGSFIIGIIRKIFPTCIESIW